MNRFYEGWIGTARDKVIACGLTWNPEHCPTTGKIVRAQRWNLTELVGLCPPPTHWFSSFAYVEDDIVALNNIRTAQSDDLARPRVMSREWQECLQAALVHVLLMKRNKLSQAMAYYRAIRTLSLTAAEKKPWHIRAEDVQLAYNVALRTGNSGKLALNLKMVVGGLFDAESLADHVPLYQFAQPMGTKDLAKRRVSCGRKSGGRAQITTFTINAAALPIVRALNVYRRRRRFGS